MDDEEEDMSRPISRWGTPLGDVKSEERDLTVPTSQSHNINNNGVGVNALSRTLHRPPRVPVHGELRLDPIAGQIRYIFECVVQFMHISRLFPLSYKIACII